jgi:hypothetical protein
MEGYPRHDFRTGIRLLHLADALDTYYGGRAAVIGWRFADYPRLRRALDVLPGWGPLTTALFLREMRGVWPAAQPPLDLRAAAAARHLHLTSAGHGQPDLDFLTRLAADSELDVREVESALIRLAQAHPQRMERCPGGPACTIVTARVRHQQAS